MTTTTKQNVVVNNMKNKISNFVNLYDKTPNIKDRSTAKMRGYIKRTRQ